MTSRSRSDEANLGLDPRLGVATDNVTDLLRDLGCADHTPSHCSCGHPFKHAARVKRVELPCWTVMEFVDRILQRMGIDFAASPAAELRLDFAELGPKLSLVRQRRKLAKASFLRFRQFIAHGRRPFCAANARIGKPESSVSQAENICVS